MVVLPVLALLLAPAPSPSPVPSCRELPGASRLDFWLGRWDVYVDGTRVGSNHIGPILDGCALLESWSASGGGEGRSLFYLVPALGTWKQVWVTDRAARPGGVKEKRLVESEAPGVRFQGEVPLAGGGTYLDRTTLVPNPDGTVRQTIEISRDGGRTWSPTFDARYVRRPDTADDTRRK